MGDEPTTGLPGDYHDAANSMARKIQHATRKGMGCRLTADECAALDQLEGGGEWWEGLRERALSKDQADREML